jgi:hypothetical protein
MCFCEENVKAATALFTPCKAFCNKFFEDVLSAVTGEKRFYISPCEPQYEARIYEVKDDLFERLSVLWKHGAEDSAPVFERPQEQCERNSQQH